MISQKIFSHRVHNLILAVLGILLNILLIIVVLKKTKKNFRLYARLVLFNAMYDIFYSFVEILCQHVSGLQFNTLMLKAINKMK